MCVSVCLLWSTCCCCLHRVAVCYAALTHWDVCRQEAEPVCYALRPVHCLFLHSAVQHLFARHNKTVPTMAEDSGETLCALLSTLCNLHCPLCVLLHKPAASKVESWPVHCLFLHSACSTCLHATTRQCRPWLKTVARHCAPFQHALLSTLPSYAPHRPAGSEATSWLMSAYCGAHGETPHALGQQDIRCM